MKRTRPAALAAAVGLLLLAACSAEGTDAVAVGESIDVGAGDSATLAVTVTDVRSGTTVELGEMGVDASSLAGRTPWFVTVTMGLTEGTLDDVDRALVPSLAPDGWSGRVSGGGDAEPLRVIGDFDCTADGSATAGFSDTEPLVDCVALLTAAGAELSSVTLADIGTWDVATD
ncbi:hypothetical protein EXU48_14560 [Occultella glacieicola]|uniref:Lipoprotein n=1 Tax=Occultella glacieicola TaxID=2518684 RepID=A0ABY2E4H4_9MICO|nr:hypothetical protein [Occultella glacieicola]TDE92738.1 hypothetical protein EXU48_14560 [Occultella glacieicola]